MYLSRRTTKVVDGQRYRSAEVAELENLAHEVIALKEKLGEPLLSGVTGIVLFYESIRNIPWDQRPRTEEEIDLARGKADALRSEIKQRSSYGGYLVRMITETTFFANAKKSKKEKELV